MNEIIHCLSSLDDNQLNELLRYIMKVKSKRSMLFIAGNGGSYTTALHWGLDLLKSYNIRTYVLGSNPGLLTACSNDISYRASYSYELERMSVRDTDVLVVLSCSGTSDNVYELLFAARKLGIISVLITSKLCEHRVAHLTIQVDSIDYGAIEDTHLAILHWIIRHIDKG